MNRKDMWERLIEDCLMISLFFFLLGLGKACIHTSYAEPPHSSQDCYEPTYSSIASMSPLVLDFDGNDTLDASHDGEWREHNKFDITRTTRFDIDGDGKTELTEWLGPHDALLCIPDKDGKVVNAKQLFGTAGGHKDGFEKLGKYDTNRDGKITGDELTGLCIWQDRNSNGKAEKEELKSLRECGISEMSLNHAEYQSTFVMNGKVGKMWDWWPSVRKLE